MLPHSTRSPILAVVDIFLCPEVDFEWQRGRVFDHTIATVLYEMCVEAETATVTAVEHSPRSKYKPLPLSTVSVTVVACLFGAVVSMRIDELLLQVEMQKRASRYLKLSAEKTMSLAESLYNKG